VLIIHQVCRELMGGNFELKLSEVPHARMVISGDLHEFKHRRNVREQGKALQALSPGATCVRKSNEPAHHYLVELREDLSWKRLRLRSRIRIDYAIESARDFEQMFENLPETLDATAALAEEKKLPLELQRPFLMIKDSSDVLDLRRRLQQVVGDRVHLFYSKTSLGFEAEAALRDCNVAPELSVGEMINQETDNRDVAEFLTAALESDSPRQFLKQYRKKL